METTVTGLFADATAAQAASHGLAAAGFAAEAIEVITDATEDRHRLLAEETSDVGRGARLGAAVGALGMAIGGVVMSVPPVDLFEFSPVVGALAFGALGAIGGTLIGLLVGSATGHQVQEEYEHGIDAGAVVLAVNTDRVHAPRALEALRRAGGSLLSTSVHRRHRGPAARTA